ALSSLLVIRYCLVLVQLLILSWIPGLPPEERPRFGRTGTSFSRRSTTSCPPQNQGAAAEIPPGAAHRGDAQRAAGPLPAGINHSLRRGTEHEDDPGRLV